MQPIASDDVAAALTDVALAEPIDGMTELAGPDLIRPVELVRQYLRATGDPREVITDKKALYSGAAVNDQSLIPDANPRPGATHFADWLSRSVPRRDLTQAV